MPLINISHGVKMYKPGDDIVYAINDISLSISKGELVSIVGQSGSGKSTLMNVLGCLDTLTSGEYLLDNVSVLDMTDEEISNIRNKKIGFIFQGFNLISTLSALQNVELPLIYRGIRKSVRNKLAVEALKNVGLANRLHHTPSQMSGGQQQRVAIARAIAQAPPIILADEPTGNLDSKSSQEILDILIGLHKQGRTVIIITHDMQVAEAANRVITISDGKIVSDKARR